MQSILALSSIEAEYVAAIEGEKEATWLCGLELGVQQDTIIVFSDSHSAIHLMKKMMHIIPRISILKYHYIRNTMTKGEIVVKKIYTTENPTDMLTKSLPLLNFKHILNLASVYNT